MFVAVEYVVAVLASLSLGAPFLPLDPLWPVGKLEAMVVDATPSVVVCSANAPPVLRLPAQCSVVEVPVATSGAETPKHELSDGSSTQQHCPRVAYVMYTSGSSGSPRGVRPNALHDTLTVSRSLGPHHRRPRLRRCAEPSRGYSTERDGCLRRTLTNQTTCAAAKRLRASSTT